MNRLYDRKNDFKIDGKVLTLQSLSISYARVLFIFCCGVLQGCDALKRPISVQNASFEQSLVPLEPWERQARLNGKLFGDLSSKQWSMPEKSCASQTDPIRDERYIEDRPENTNE